MRDEGISFSQTQNLMTVMESLDQKGMSLKMHLAENGGKLPVRTAFHVIEQILLAVKEVHDAGFLHLDIQDGNIFIKGSISEKNDMVSLIDFGTARERLEDGYTDIISDKVLFSANGFSAPEMLLQNDGTLRLGPEADIYSIGYILLKLLTGRYYDTKEILSVTDGHFITGRKLRNINCPKHMTDRMQGILAKALAAERENRYQSCSEMMNDISDFISALNPYRSDLAAAAYDAFICYRHGDIDSQAAVSLQKNLEHFGSRSSVFKKKEKQIHRVFVDEGELSSCSDFGLQIREALKNSGWLIVICSPRTKDSPWVNLEIKTFLEYHDRSRILAVMTGGEPEDIFPDLLLGKAGANMVLASDARDTNLRRILKKLNGDALLKIAAPILGTSFDSLKQRKRAYMFQRTAIAASMTTLLLISLVLYTTYQSQRVREQYHKTQTNLARNLSKEANEQMDEGDRIGALETLLTSAQGDFDREEPLVPEQIYALNRALYANQHNDDADYIYDPLCMQKMDGFTSDVNDICKDSNLFLSLDSEGDAYFYDTENGICLWKISSTTYCPEETKGFVWGKFINASEVLLVSENYFYVISTEQKQCTAIWASYYKNGSSYLSDDHCTFYTLQNNLFAVSYSDNTFVYIYDLSDNDPAQTVQSINSLPDNNWFENIPTIEDVEFSDDASLLAISVVMTNLSDSEVGNIIIIDLSEQQIIQSISFSGAATYLKFVTNEILGAFCEMPGLGNGLGTDENVGVQSVFDLKSGEEVWTSESHYYNDEDKYFNGILNLDKFDFDSSNKNSNFICFYCQNLLTILNRKDWTIQSERLYEDKISGISRTPDNDYLMIMLKNGTIQTYDSGNLYQSGGTQQDLSFSYYCLKTNTIIQVGHSGISDAVIFLKEMQDEQIEQTGTYISEETAEYEYIFISTPNDLALTEKTLTGEKYGCTYNYVDENLKLYSLQNQKEILNITPKQTNDLLFRFINQEQNFLMYDGAESTLTIWDTVSGEIVAQQNLNLKSRFKSRCIVDEVSHYLVLELERGYTTDIDEDNAFERRTMDLFYFDENLEFYEYVGVPFGHYDMESHKVYVGSTDRSDLYSYQTLLQMAKDVVSKFDKINAAATDELTDTAATDSANKITPSVSSVLIHKEQALEEALEFIENSGSYLSRQNLVDHLTNAGFSAKEADYAVENCGIDWKEAAVSRAISSLDTFKSEQSLRRYMFDKGYTEEEINYAIDHCEVDWKEQAILEAKSYLETGSMSYTGLVDQLEHEGFTHEDSESAAQNCGADWNHEAVEAAELSLNYSDSLSYNDLLTWLIRNDGFTEEQAEYGITHAME